MGKDKTLSRNEWGMIVIHELTHAEDPILQNQLEITVHDVRRGSILIEYTIQTARQEIFDIVMSHIQTAENVNVDDMAFPILSNIIDGNDLLVDCLNVGEQCNSKQACCNDMDSILCV